MMTKPRVLWVALAVASLAITLASGAAVAQGEETGVSGAGGLSFPDGATFNGVSLSGVQLGTGLTIAADGTATGHLLAVLVGTTPLGTREIEVDGTVSTGSVGTGSATFAGTATVDMGDGSVPVELPFSATATAESLLVTLGASTLPTATLTAGSIAIE